MTTPDTSTEALYEGPCEAGCSHYHGGEVRHTPGCGHYPNSLTKVFEDQISALAAERDAVTARADTLQADLTFMEQNRNSWMASATSRHWRICALEAEVQKMRKALKWYEEKARLCRLIHSGARHALHDDGGAIARAALTPPAPEEPKA